MNALIISPLLSEDAAALVRRVGMILLGLAGLVAARFLRRPRLVGLIGPLWRRLTRVAGRVERAMLQPDRVRAARVPGARGVRAVGVQLPAGKAWLVRELGWEAAGYGCQLEALLAEPQMAAVVAGMPAIGRVLAPVCRMLGVAAPAAPPRKKPQDFKPINEAENEDGGQDVGKNQHPDPHLHSQHTFLGYGVQGPSLVGPGAKPQRLPRPREGPPAVP